jgi:hypothetical protein
MRTTATWDDYHWFGSSTFRAWRESGYCITQISDAAPADVLDGLAAERISAVVGVNDLHIRAAEAWDARGGGPFGKMLVAVTAVGSATLMAESNGFIGVTPERMAPLSRGRQIVSCYYALGRSQFSWWIDGTLELQFEPLFPGIDRTGAHANSYLEHMSEVGLDVGMTRDVRDVPLNEATLALAERVTGVCIVPEVFDRSMFRSDSFRPLHQQASNEAMAR